MYIEKLEAALSKRYGMEKQAFWNNLLTNAGNSLKQVGYGLGDTFRGIGRAWDSTVDAAGKKIDSWNTGARAAWNEFAGNTDWAEADRKLQKQQEQAASKAWGDVGDHLSSAGKGALDAGKNAVLTGFNTFTIPGLAYSGYKGWKAENEANAKKRMEAKKPKPATPSNPFPNNLDKTPAPTVDSLPETSTLTQTQVGPQTTNVPTYSTLPDGYTPSPTPTPQQTPQQPASQFPAVQTAATPSNPFARSTIPQQPAPAPATQPAPKPGRRQAVPQIGSARRPSRMTWTRPDGSVGYRVNGQEVDQTAYDAAGQTRRQNGFYASSSPSIPVISPTVSNTSQRPSGYNWGNLSPRQREQHNYNMHVSGYTNLPGGVTAFRTARPNGNKQMHYATNNDFAAMRRGTYARNSYGSY